MSNYAFKVQLWSKHQKPEKSNRTIRCAFASVIRQLKLSGLLGSYKIEVTQLEDVVSASDRGFKPPCAAEGLMEVKRTLVSERWREDNHGWWHTDHGGCFTILEALYIQTRALQRELIEANLSIDTLRKACNYENIL